MCTCCNGCCCINKAPSTRLVCAGVLSLLAFFSPSWIFSLQYVKGNGVVQLDTTYAFGVIYPFIKEGYGSNSVQSTVPYSNKNDLKSFCHHAPTLASCGGVPGAEKPKCKAIAKICGSQFRAAAAFNFFQGTGAIVASFLAKRNSVSAAKGLAAASVFSGLIAMACVADVIRLLRVAWPSISCYGNCTVANIAPLPFVGMLFCILGMGVAAAAGHALHTRGNDAMQAPLLVGQYAPMGGQQFQQQPPMQQQQYMGGQQQQQQQQQQYQQYMGQQPPVANPIMAQPVAQQQYAPPVGKYS